MTGKLESQIGRDRQDEQRLAQFGIKQELRRDWSFIHNFGVSFSIIGVIVGLTTDFETGLTIGGPAVMCWGWIVVCVMTFFGVGLSMAEVVSAVPISAGPYYWAAMLSPPKYSAFFSWMTGWFNFLGQVGITTGVNFGCAQLISAAATVKTDYEATAAKTIGIYAAILCSQAMLNTFGVHVLQYFNDLSILFHSVGVSSLCIAVLAKAPTHQSAKFVFTKFYDGTGDPGWSVRASPEYVAIIGILMSQYTITGYDASAHMSEETHNAAWSAPLGVITAIGVSFVFGFFVILSFLFSIQDFDRTINSPYGEPVLQIFVDVFGKTGGVGAFSVILVCVWLCGLFCITSNSRMFFAFARDGGVPRWFSHVNSRFRCPVRTIWLAAFLAFCLGLPSLGSSVAFTAATSITTIGLYISYSLPVLVGLIFPKYFRKGPFNLGKFSRLSASICCLWVGFITIVFCLPTANPVTVNNLNYASVAVGIVGGCALLVWIVTARRWFKGPLRPEEDGDITIMEGQQYITDEKEKDI